MLKPAVERYFFYVTLTGLICPAGHGFLLINPDICVCTIIIILSYFKLSPSSWRFFVVVPWNVGWSTWRLVKCYNYTNRLFKDRGVIFCHSELTAASPLQLVILGFRVAAFVWAFGCLPRLGLGFVRRTRLRIAYLWHSGLACLCRS